jgi:succinyl-CoA synthetase beta subunit
LKLYEHEAKKIIATYGVPTPRSGIVVNHQQASETASNIGYPVVLKAQVLVAGRGKAGGVLFSQTPKEAEEASTKLFGSQIKGETVESILVEEKLSIKKDLYFSITVDRFNRCYIALASRAGGADI